MSPNTSFRRPPLQSTHNLSPSHLIKTVSQLIDFNARENPDYVFCKQMESSQGGGQVEFQDVTYSGLEKAILACQTNILSVLDETDLPKRDECGKAVKRRPVGLLMESDLSILIYLFSLLGLGIPVLLLSCRLSLLAIKSLLVETGTSIIYVSPRYEQLAKEALAMLEQEQPRSLLNLRLSYKLFLDSLISGSRDRVYDDSHYMRDDDRDVLILHSSGTTDLPKPIHQSHGYILNYATCHDLPNSEAAQSLNLSTLPLFHGFGLVAPLLSMSVGKSFIIPSSKFSHMGRQISVLLKQFSLGSLMTVPVTLQELMDLDDPETVQTLQALDFVACGGGTLKESVGEYLAAVGVTLVNSYGCTEAGPLSIMHIPASNHDWRYFTLRTDMGINIIEDDGPANIRDSNRFRLSVQPPGWAHTFEMQDLFSMNPDVPNRQFRPLERTDDVIVLKTGEKVSPYILETILAERDDVRGVLIFGHGQSQLGVLVESREILASHTLDEFTNRILDTVLGAGRATDAHARIVSREAIVVLQPGQNLPRSDKGAILRRAAYEVYNEEIEQAYKLLNNIFLGRVTSVLPGDVEENLQRLVKTRILRPGQVRDFTSSVDLFDLGIDSLQATQLRNYLFSSLAAESGDSQTAAKTAPRDFVYIYPTISKMIERLNGLSTSSSFRSKEEVIQSFIQEYSIKPTIENLPQLDTKLSTVRPIRLDGAVVLLTGTSGGLGSHILAQLVAKDSVKHIVCLNRPSVSSSDPYQRQYDCSKAKGADIPHDLRKRIEVLDTVTSDPYLGLSETVYHRFTTTVTHIVHNAWPMDFKRQLPSFRQQFQVLSNLVRFCQDARANQHLHGATSATVPVRLLFLSSISVVGNHENNVRRQDSLVITEEPAHNFHGTLPLGYAEAKLVCENIVQNATQTGEIDGIVVRLGQLSGAIKNGYWNTSEHFPMMVQSSVHIGALPYLQGTLSWLPLEPASETIVDLLLSAEANSRLVYHVENPKRQPWEFIMSELAKNLSLRVVPYHEWIKLVRDLSTKSPVDAESGSHGSSYSSHDLLEFLEGLFERMSCGSIVLSTENTRRISPTLRQSEIVGPDLLGVYLKFWRTCGFFFSESETLVRSGGVEL